MNKFSVWIVGAALAGGAMTAAQAFPITFAQALCSLGAAELDESVRGFQDRLEYVKRFQAVGSQYRKHVERHTGELIEAFDVAQKQETCSVERKARIQQFKVELEQIRAGRPDV